MAEISKLIFNAFLDFYCSFLQLADIAVMLIW